MSVFIYAQGLVHCSVCAPKHFTASEVEKAVNRQLPTGISSRWEVSDDKTFVTGEENGGIVHCSKGETRHWLLSC